MLKNLWSHISRRRQKQFLLLLVLMVIASLLEVISVGAVLPFLTVLTNPEKVYQHPFIQPIIQILELNQPEQLILPITIFFIIAVLLSGVIRLTLLYALTRFSFATGADLSIDIYRRTLYQEYAVHMSRNSSEVIDSIITKTNLVIYGVLTPILMLISSVIIVIGIISALFVVNINVALITFIGFGFPYWLVARYTKSRLMTNSSIVAKNSTQMVKALQEGLGGIRDVLIDGTQDFYCQIYRNADLPLRRASGSNQFISGSPKFIMEVIGMTFIATIAYVMTQQDGGAGAVIPVLGALALGAQRLLPALQQSYGAYSQIKGSSSSFSDVLDFLNQPLPEYARQSQIKKISFQSEIKLTNLCFRYTHDSPWVLKNIDLSIKKGECVGFIGETGSGKSTLLDVIMGLIPVTSGKLIADQELISARNCKSWRAGIAHVPQNIYLSDDTIESNIAFGIPKDQINRQLLKKVARQAQILELIEQWKDGFQTLVGEQGARISGGQRQRIGIARALYKQSEVLILDEATSALDSKTESLIMESIGRMGKEVTILIVAHRLTTLKNCDKIIEMDKNNTLRIKTYDQIIK